MSHRKLTISNSGGSQVISGTPVKRGDYISIICDLKKVLAVQYLITVVF
jgi:hypothetical protein